MLIKLNDSLCSQSAIDFLHSREIVDPDFRRVNIDHNKFNQVTREAIRYPEVVGPIPIKVWISFSTP